MKILTTSVILSFALIGAAHAATPLGDPNNVPFQGVNGKDRPQSSVTRAQVRADSKDAKAAGWMTVSEPNNMTFTGDQKSTTTREQVKAEVRATPGATSFGDPNNMPFQAR
ncbi:hypothetical protein ASB57_15510 [Bordetella sp. N]|nr:hypothetical protein ASB57_15510 [Bordetella sp. N]